MDVLVCAIEGRGNADTAGQLGMTIGNVKAIRRKLRIKYNASNTTQLVAMAFVSDTRRVVPSVKVQRPDEDLIGEAICHIAMAGDLLCKALGDHACIQIVTRLLDRLHEQRESLYASLN